MTFGGTILGTTSNAYIQSAIDWYYETRPENNSTTVTARLYYRRTNSGYTTSGTGAFTITINGTTFSQSGVSLEISSGWVEAMSASVSVLHNADGSKSVAISATGSLPPTSLTSTNCGGTITLPSIPRASTISCTAADIESYPTIRIDSKSPNFTHTVTYRFGSLTGTIKEKTSATSITDWKIPADFYAQIPNAKTGWGILTCTTYSGGTPIGDPTTCDLYVTTDEGKCKPTVSGTVVDTNDQTTAITGNPDILVRYCSTALCTINATLNKNAGSIPLKTINNVSVTGNTLEIPNVGTNIFEFYAQDSRGYFNSDKKEKTLVPYVRLTNDAEIHRDDPTSGNATLTIEGNYYNGNFGSVDNTNTLTVTYQIEGDEKPTTVTPTIKDNEYSVTVSLTGLEYTKAFNCEVVVKDRLNTVTKQLTLQKGIPVFDWGENDFNFNVPVFIMSVEMPYVIEQGTQGIWTYRKWSDGSAECRGVHTQENVAINVAWGTLFESDEYVVDLPNDLFKETPQFSITLTGSGGAMLETFSQGSATQTPHMCAVRPFAITVDVINTSIIAYGRWK